MEQEERERIIKDVINHSIEEGIAEGRAPEAELDDIEENLRDSSDEELIDWWVSTVGVWIVSMRRWKSEEYQTEDGPVWEVEGFDSIPDWQLDKLRNEGETDYGYTGPRYEQPY